MWLLWFNRSVYLSDSTSTHIHTHTFNVAYTLQNPQWLFSRLWLKAQTFSCLPQQISRSCVCKQCNSVHFHSGARPCWCWGIMLCLSVTLSTREEPWSWSWAQALQIWGFRKLLLSFSRCYIRLALLNMEAYTMTRKWLIFLFNFIPLDLPTGWEEGYTFEGARCFIKWVWFGAIHWSSSHLMLLFCVWLEAVILECRAHTHTHCRPCVMSHRALEALWRTRASFPE